MILLVVKTESGKSNKITECMQIKSSQSRKIVRESRINEIKKVKNDKPLREFTHINHRKRDFRPDI